KKCYSGADALASCLSGVGRERRYRAFSHGRSWISHSGFYRSDKRADGRQPRDRFRSGQIPPRRTSTATDGQFAAAGEGIMTPALYIALRFLTHRKRALLLSLSGVVFG